MSRGISALIGYLGIVTLAIVAVFSAAVLLGHLAPENTDGSRPGPIRQLFNSLLHALDPGTVAADTGKWPFLVAMLLLTLAGLLVVSALIGVLANVLDIRIQELRKGRSFVVEDGHTLILGWSETIFTILSELGLANESEKNPVVVVLADHDKVEMEDSIRAKVRDLGNTRVVCRTGNPIDLVDLRIVNPKKTKSIIVLAPEGEEDPDSQVIKVLLALTKGPLRRDEPYNIVAEIHNSSNLETARLVGGEEAVLLDKNETISRLLVQSSRQSGVSIVYTELLDFAGDEVYFREEPSLNGKSFSDALLAYEDCSVIGIASNGSVRINPPSETTIGAGDRLIALAEDDASLENATPAASGAEEGAIVAEPPVADAAQRILLLGWNLRAPLVIEELDDYFAKGSKLTVAAEADGAAKTVERVEGGLDDLEVNFVEANTTDRHTLERLDPLGHDSVIVLCYSDTLPPQKADARTLVTLLHLRDIADRAGREISIVSEMLDDRNRELAEVTKVNDVIVSDRVISLMLAQLSQNDTLNQVFNELFQAEGSEIYMRPAELYVKSGSPVSYATLIEAARRRGEVAIGYRRFADRDDASAGYGIRVNPPKSERLEIAPGDRAIVLAEE